jgi:undecaprenyl-diphosphatase
MGSFVNRFDKSIMHVITTWPKWLVLVMQLLSFVGYPVFTVGLTVIIGVLGIIRDNTGLVLAAIVGISVIIINCILKLVTHRARPAGHDSKHLFCFDIYSFPSGHTSGSTVTYGLLAYLLWCTLTSPFDIIVVIITAVVVIGIGISRVYIGAHYPTDVLAGWILGLLGLLTITNVIGSLL